jgi:hypothetical protein
MLYPGAAHSFKNITPLPIVKLGIHPMEHMDTI